MAETTNSARRSQRGLLVGTYGWDMLPGWSGVLLGTGTVLLGPILPKRFLKSRSGGG